MVDVLVIGAGPVGLFVACELARHGVSVRVIEKRTEIVQKSKAIMLHSRTLEALEIHGIINAFLQQGHRLNRLGMYSGNKQFASLPMEMLDSPYPFILCLQQYKTEAILEQRLFELGGQLDRGVAMTDIIQENQSVLVKLEQNGVKDECKAQWIICCDGSHSSSRKALDISYTGEDIDVQFTLADVEMNWDKKRDEVLSFFTSKGIIGFIPLPEPKIWRMFASIPLEDRGALSEPSLSFYQQLIDERLGEEISISSPLWMSHFGVRQRKVGQYRKGRVFLAGDAAHCHSPAGGQGMNTGLQDAANLAWKLALVVKGTGRSKLLDSYNDEREPIATELLKNTGLQTRINTISNPIGAAIRNQLVSFLTRLKGLQSRIVSSLGQLNINYRQSSIVHYEKSSFFSAGGPQAGDRAIDAVFGDGTNNQRLYEIMAYPQHTLLLFSGESPTKSALENLTKIAENIQFSYSTQIRIHIVVPFSEKPVALKWEGSTLLDCEGTIHKRYGNGSECLYLIRPDGYVGYRSNPVNSKKFKDFLARIFLS